MQPRATDTDVSVKAPDVDVATRKPDVDVKPGDVDVTTRDTRTTTQSTDTTAMQTDEGVVRSVTNELIVIERDNGSQVRIKASGASVMMPTVGQRVYVQYRLDGMERIATKIEQR